VSEAAVVVDGVSKRFRLYHERNQSLKATLLRRRRSVVEEFWALRDVSLEIPAGITFGLVGPNGSGKSTLMKCITKILRPDVGTVTVNGKASALLELGAGFHPELSGRENIFLNGSILGLSRKELDHRLGDIVDFAGLHQFIDQPVKNYSSGMYVRLGFAVAINVDPDILLVDEVLAVGDEVFQRRCQEKFIELKDAGKTIVIVTHDLAAITNLCDDAAYLEDGQLKVVDSARRVIDQYMNSMHDDGPASEHDSDGDRWGSGEARIEHAELLAADGTPVTRPRSGQPLSFRFHYRFDQPIERPVFGMAVHTLDGTYLTGPNTRYTDCVPDRLEGCGHVDLHLDRLLLLPGTYDLTAVIYDYSCVHPYDHRHRAFRFHVDSGDLHETYGMVSLGGRWTGPLPE
jgi:ABC-2 type transport system ATP-binding protein